MRQELLTIYNLREELKETEKKAAKKMGEGIPYVLVLEDKTLVFSAQGGLLSVAAAEMMYGESGRGEISYENRINIATYAPPTVLDVLDDAFEASGEKRKGEWFDAEITEALIAYNDGAALPEYPRGGEKKARTTHVRPITYDGLKEAAEDAGITVAKLIVCLMMMRFGEGEK